MTQFDEILKTVRERFWTAYYTRLEYELKRGIETGMDVAVSPIRSTPEGIACDIIRIHPLENNRVGRGWTIYKSSKFSQ